MIGRSRGLRDVTSALIGWRGVTAANVPERTGRGARGGIAGDSGAGSQLSEVGSLRVSSQSVARRPCHGAELSVARSICIQP